MVARGEPATAATAHNLLLLLSRSAAGAQLLHSQLLLSFGLGFRLFAQLGHLELLINIVFAACAFGFLQISISAGVGIGSSCRLLNCDVLRLIGVVELFLLLLFSCALNDLLEKFGSLQVLKLLLYRI